MRVMLVSHRFPPDDLGGVEQYTQSLAVELTRSGDSVSIVARRSTREFGNTRFLREQLPGGIPLYRLLAARNSPERFLDGHREIHRLFTMALLEAAPEVVHVNHLMGFTPLVVWLAHRFGAAVVVSLHDFYFACPRVHLQKPTGELCKGPEFGRECAATCFRTGTGDDRQYWGLRAMYFQRALEAAERVIAYSQYVAKYFEPMRSFPIDVIENGVPTGCVRRDSSAPSEEATGTLTLAYCGTVSRHKGPHLILEALRIANLERVRLRIIGNAPDRAYASRLRDKAATIPGLHLQMYGKFSRDDLPLLLGGVDCMVVPSLVPEAGPIVPREALAAGIPVVASRLGALPELIVEGNNGFTFDPARPADLAAILRRLAHTKDLLPRLRDGARESPVMTLAAHAARVRSLYAAAIGQFSIRPPDLRQGAELKFLHDTLAGPEQGGERFPHGQVQPVCAAQAAGD